MVNERGGVQQGGTSQKNTNKKQTIPRRFGHFYLATGPKNCGQVTPVVEAPPTPVEAPARALADDAQRSEERLLLSRAQVALARSRPMDAIAALEEHEQRFARGWLSEERDALYVQALASAHRTTEARTRASAFATAYPRSVFRALVDRAATLD
jgi:hypothetical protein